MFFIAAAFFVFVLGLVFGSFVNVVVDRLPQGKKISGRSRCDYCKKALEPRDLVPLVSFLFSRGRCRYCKKKLSRQYPLVELATGLIFAAVFLLNSSFSARGGPAFGGQPAALLSLVYLLFVAVVFWIVFLTDLKFGVIPGKVVLVGVSGVLVNYLVDISYNFYKLYSYLSAGGKGSLGSYLLETDFLKNRLLILAHPLASGILAGAAVAGFFAFLIWITKGRGMGGGDVSLGFLMGLTLGPAGTVVAIMMAFLSGALVSLALIAVGKKKFGQTVPFGPFLAASSIVSLFFGSQIWRWYLGTI